MAKPGAVKLTISRDEKFYTAQNPFYNIAFDPPLEERRTRLTRTGGPRQVLLGDSETSVFEKLNRYQINSVEVSFRPELDKGERAQFESAFGSYGEKNKVEVKYL